MPITYGTTNVENISYNGTTLDKVVYNGVTVWETYNKPHTFKFSDELSSSSLSIDKYYALPDGLVTEVNAYYRHVHSSNNDCKMGLALYDETGTKIARMVASYYVIEEMNNSNGTFSTSQGGDGNYGSYIKYKFNKPTKLSKINVWNFSDVGQWQKYGVRGNVQMLTK